jgi:4-diphosphocytidyl-2-C-methyl-D-erythritol kinase
VIESAPAKINLALVVGPLRADGKHEVATVLEHVDLADTIAAERAEALTVGGFPGDTLVRRALEEIATAVGVTPGFAATIEKRIPVAAGLGGGSSDAAAALRLANALLGDPLVADELAAVATRLGADVPFFLRRGAQLGTGDGSTLEPLDLPTGYHALLWLPEGAVKESTAHVYARFDERGGEQGFAARREALLAAVAQVRWPEDLARLPGNDLAASPLAEELVARGAFRADVSGAGPALYGLFAERRDAVAAADDLGGRGRIWLAQPCWYG